MAENKEVKTTETVGNQPNNRSRKIIRQPRRDKAQAHKPRSDEFDKKIISIRRVTRVYKGGKRMRLSVFIVAGNKKGKVGLGIGKGADVKSAEEKAYTKAMKNMVMVNLKGKTIPHEVSTKYKAAKILMRPAAPGTGVIAGSSVRSVLELAGVKDILTKQLGANNAVNNAYATMSALKELRLGRL